MAVHTIFDRVYENELSQWLPKRMIDCHVHVCLAQHWGDVSTQRLRDVWPMEVATHHSWQEMRNNLRVMLPEQEVSVLAFSYVFREVDIRANNNYILEGSRDPANQAKVLLATRPDWDPAVIEQAMAQGFVGIKPYPEFAPQGHCEVSIYDYLPRKHLAVVNRLGGVVMLHLPRVGRIGHPDNVRELLEISDSYPSVKLIVAHIGRAYCLPTAERGLPSLANRTGILFDTAANLNADVLQYALELLGPERILYGSDLPVTKMRGTREHVGERYVNYTSGSYSWNTNRKNPEEEANYTYFLYEELRALKCAVERAGLGTGACESIFHNNAMRLLGAPVNSAIG